MSASGQGGQEDSFQDAADVWVSTFCGSASYSWAFCGLVTVSVGLTAQWHFVTIRCSFWAELQLATGAGFSKSDVDGPWPCNYEGRTFSDVDTSCREDVSTGG